jgi:class 3 adenylate cyclase
MDYTAVGQTTHLAARMEQLARPGTTLMTEAALHEAEGYVQVKPLGPTPIKGLTEPIPVYEVVGAGAARTRLQAAAHAGSRVSSGETPRSSSYKRGSSKRHAAAARSSQ